MSEPGAYGDRVHASLFVGREHELSAFTPISEAVRDDGSGIIGISGRAGVGKTVLMRRLAAEHAAAVTAYGKYDSVRTRPYEGIAGALSDLVGRLEQNGEPGWQDKLRDAVGDGAEALSGLVPRLADLLEADGQISAPDPEVVLARLQQAVLALIKFVTQQGISVTLMIDDLQWARTNSMVLIELLAEARFPGLLVICAWPPPSDESKAPYPALTAVFPLGGIDDNAISQLFTEISGRQPDDQLVRSLAEETGGNPQFLSELIKTDLGEGRLNLNQQTGRWTWDQSGGSGSELAGGLARILSKRLDQLPTRDADVISTAASLGTSFLLSDVGAAADETPDVVSNVISSPSAQSLIVVADVGPGPARYRFAHDRIGELAAQRLTTKQQQEARLRLGQALLNEGDERFSDAVIHMTAGADLLTHSDERASLAGKTLQAGKQAAGQAAFSIAFDLFSVGCDLLHETEGQTHSELARDLNTSRAEAAWLVGDDDVAEFLDLAMQQELPKAERARLAAIRMKVYLAGEQRDEALRLGRSALAEMGVKLPTKPTKAGLVGPLLKTKMKLRRLDIDDLKKQAVTTEESAIFDEPVLVEMISTTYIGDLKLFPYVVLRAVDLTLERGRLPMSPVAFAGYAGSCWWCLATTKGPGVTDASPWN